MCIRDSPSVTGGQGVGSARGGVEIVAVDDRCQGEPLGAEPVSYTHLRAHETVLDLVCRLLLETKQHK